MKSSTKVHLLCIDPQNDFCNPQGALFVPGADEDMQRLVSMTTRLNDVWDDIHVTLDSHHEIHIAHPVVWKDAAGNHPDPFTLITASDVENGVWMPINPNWRDRFLAYTRSLEQNGRYVLVIWPVHCVIGSWGHSIVPELSDAFRVWEKTQIANVDYVTKGSNSWTEHYSAVKADVEDQNDPGTQLNFDLINTLKTADIIAITGEALSHCVANTIRDIADNFGEENIKKFVLIKDTCSNVPTFEQLGDDFVNEMAKRGMEVDNADSFLSKTVVAV